MSAQPSHLAVSTTKQLNPHWKETMIGACLVFWDEMVLRSTSWKDFQRMTFPGSRAEMTD